ncbi:MAG: type III secretion system translocon subunit SctE [Planctomycetota bacterium]
MSDTSIGHTQPVKHSFGDTPEINEKGGKQQQQIDTFFTFRSDEKTRKLLSEELGLPPVNISGADLAVAVSALRQKTQNTRLMTAMETIQANKRETQQKAKERIDKTDEAQQKQTKAAKKSKRKKIWGWIGAVAMTLGGLAVCCIPGGQAIGGAMLAAGICSLVTCALQTDFNGDGQTGMQKMMKGMGEFYGMMNPNATEEQKAQFAFAMTAAIAITLSVAVAAAVPGPGVVAALSALSSLSGAFITPENMQAMGMTDKQANGWSTGITIGLAVATLIVGFGTSMGASSSKTVSATAKAVDKADDIAGAASKTKKAVTLMDKYKNYKSAGESFSNSSRMRRAGQIGGYLADASGGGTDIAKGVLTIQAGKLNHGAKELFADVKKLVAWLVQLADRDETEKERLEEIIEQLNQDFVIVSEIMKDQERVDRKVVTPA